MFAASAAALATKAGWPPAPRTEAEEKASERLDKALTEVLDANQVPFWIARTMESEQYGPNTRGAHTPSQPNPGC